MYDRLSWLLGHATSFQEEASWMPLNNSESHCLAVSLASLVVFRLQSDQHLCLDYRLKLGEMPKANAQLAKLLDADYLMFVLHFSHC